MLYLIFDNNTFQYKQNIIIIIIIIIILNIFYRFVSSQ